ncbi:hypothetical protein LIER_29144 [Lithospermum erythrorhizon]|uniref:Reverse transcriptase n=1 Tax=Lithospermum erythrorhizon TaxID=34254 RepID=A0AAV3RMC8_LITER
MIYEAISGQSINYQKTTVWFSPNTNEALKVEVLSILGVAKVTSHNKYLGLPSSIGRSKKEGGMGFRRMETFNLALLTKQAWRLVTEVGNELTSTLKAKYYPETSFWDASLRSNPSYAWRSILQSREILRKGCRWKVGDGHIVRIWQDSWVTDDKANELLSPPPTGFENARVSLFMDNHNRKWDEEFIRELFCPVEAELILAMLFPNIGVGDIAIWAHSANGLFEVKKEYHLAYGL